MSKTGNHTQVLYIRNFIFGVEDSLVSTVGLLSGIAAAGQSHSAIFTTGVVLIFVEAFSMGVGSYLSETFAQDFSEIKNHTKFKGCCRSIIGALIMLFSYLAAGFIPLSPYLIFETQTGLIISVSFSLISLFLLGSVSAKAFEINPLKHGLRMFLIGGTAILLGIVVGKSLPI